VPHAQLYFPSYTSDIEQKTCSCTYRRPESRLKTVSAPHETPVEPRRRVIGNDGDPPWPGVVTWWIPRHECRLGYSVVVVASTGSSIAGNQILLKRRPARAETLSRRGVIVAVGESPGTTSHLPVSEARTTVEQRTEHAMAEDCLAISLVLDGKIV